ncbi:hypothetical protein RJ640_014472 [Escallonia rubra]|uniref:ADF-H domain-containing protein n=1 Tax=Escallonia rubra TaxID=112253 RepID=A0AA88RIG7_9ASTE|nr:hypothetical protein RJ640_014472 [Escallonia rubra]
MVSPLNFSWYCSFLIRAFEITVEISVVSSNFVRDDPANAASGIAVHDDCKLRFLELKAKRTFRSIVFKIEEKQKEVIVEKLGDPEQSYEDFAASLPADECRYAVYDFDFVTAENLQKSRIFFIAWSPDTSRVRSKMIYASSKDRFKRELDGIQVELQATDPTEICLDTLQEWAWRINNSAYFLGPKEDFNLRRVEDD